MVCVCRSGVYFSGSPLSLQRVRESSKVKTRSEHAQLSQLTTTSMSEGTRKHHTSLLILLSAPEQQLECTGSESRKNPAFVIRMMRVVSVEDFLIRLRKGVPQTGPSSNHRILTQSQERRYWAKSLFSFPTTIQQIPLNMPCRQKTPEKHSISGNRQILNIFI